MLVGAQGIKHKRATHARREGAFADQSCCHVSVLRELDEKWAQNLRQEHDLLAKPDASHSGLFAEVQNDALGEIFLDAMFDLLAMPGPRAQRASSYFDFKAEPKSDAKKDEYVEAVEWSLYFLSQSSCGHDVLLSRLVCSFPVQVGAQERDP